MGLTLLRKAGIPAMVLSTEKNPVVSARCRKLELPVIQGVEHKAIVLRSYLQENQINPENVIFVGNDVNDIPCFPLVGCALVVADAHPQAKNLADLVLQHNGGNGAVREVCDWLLQNVRTTH